MKRYFTTLSVFVCCCFSNVYAYAPDLQQPLQSHTYTSAKPYRTITAKDPKGYLLELDDGAVWRAVDTWAAKTIKNWKRNDPIVIYPTFSQFWNGSRFYLLNDRTGEKANAEIGLGPIKSKESYHRIVRLNHNIGYVEVTNSIGNLYRWTVRSLDLHHFAKWRNDDCIIFGLDDNASSSSPYMLINVDRDNVVFASAD